MRTSTMHPLIEAVTDLWFGRPVGRQRTLWFAPPADLDARIRRDFGVHIERATAGRYDHLTETPQGALALTVLLDQFPRNAFRGTAAAFAFDDLALSIAREAVRRRLDAPLLPVQRLFLYLPFEHAEDLDDQDTAVALIAPLGNAGWTFYAERHREIIARFGRFPHRNAILGRETTAEEAAFLKEPFSGF